MHINSVNVSNLNPWISKYDTELEIKLAGNQDEMFKIYEIIINNRGDTMGLKEMMNKWAKEMNQKTIKAPMFGGAFFDENNELIYIEKVLYNEPATIVFWNDGTKTVSKCGEGDTYNAEMGLALAVMKKLVSNEFVSKTLHDWMPADGKKIRALTEIRREHKTSNKEDSRSVEGK